MVKSALAKFVSVKVAAAAIGVAVAGGGVALAASSGMVPTSGLGAGEAASHAPAHPTGKPADVAAKGTSESGTAAGAPTPSLVGLCRAYAAGAADNAGKVLDNPAFQALILAAGGEDKVAGYCEATLANEPDARPAEAPAGKPSPVPARTPTMKPHDPSGSRPTPKATPSHPTAPAVPATPAAS